MFREHVLTIRRSKLHYTASGIITPIGGRLVYKCRRVQISYYDILESQFFGNVYMELFVVVFF